MDGYIPQYSDGIYTSYYTCPIINYDISRRTRSGVSFYSDSRPYPFYPAKILFL